MRSIKNIKEAHQSATDKESRFVMLGAIHGETGGREALISWLERIKPRAITLEFSKYGLHFRRINGEPLRKKLWDTIEDMGLAVAGDCSGPIQSLSSYLSLPYEFSTVSDYAQKTDTPFHLVDTDFFSRLKLRHIETMIDRQNLQALLCSSPQDLHKEMIRERVLAKLFFEEGITTWRYTEEMRIRDCFMKDRISLLMHHYGSGCFLHVCGWQHLWDPCDVYDSLRPIKVFIHDR